MAYNKSEIQDYDRWQNIGRHQAQDRIERHNATYHGKSADSRIDLIRQALQQGLDADPDSLSGLDPQAWAERIVATLWP